MQAEADSNESQALNQGFTISELSRRKAIVLTAAATLLVPGEPGAADPKATMTIKPLKPLLDNGRYFEACRWHNDRLWLVDSRARTLLRMADDGTAEVVCRLEGVPAGLGFLPTGEPIVTDMHCRALVNCAGGTAVQYVDLSSLTSTIDDMTIDAEGRAYVGDLAFDLKTEGIKYGTYGRLVLVEPRQAPRVVADGQ